MMIAMSIYSRLTRLKRFQVAPNRKLETRCQIVPAPSLNPPPLQPLYYTSRRELHPRVARGLCLSRTKPLFICLGHRHYIYTRLGVKG
jgi:hypothetical protein